MIYPRGIGVYMRRIENLSPAEAAKRAAVLRAAGVRWVALMVEAVNGFRSSHDGLSRMAVACREQGIAPWCWTFPHPHVRGAREAAEHACSLASALEADGVILDIEAARGSAKKPTPPTPTWVRELVRTTAHALEPEQGLGITSYPVPSMHPSMPWEDMWHGRAWGSPQTYSTALQPKLLELAFAEWGKRFKTLLPSVPAYDVSGADARTQLRTVLERVVGTPPRVPGVAVWSDPQIDAEERRVLRAFANGAGW